MKQLHIREPWAALAYKSGDQVIADLLNRIQLLEARVRELELQEMQIPASPEAMEERDAVTV